MSSSAKDEKEKGSMSTEIPAPIAAENAVANKSCSGTNHGDESSNNQSNKHELSHDQEGVSYLLSGRTTGTTDDAERECSRLEEGNNNACEEKKEPDSNLVNSSIIPSTSTGQEPRLKLPLKAADDTSRASSSTMEAAEEEEEEASMEQKETPAAENEGNITKQVNSASTDVSSAASRKSATAATTRTAALLQRRQARKQAIVMLSHENELEEDSCCNNEAEPFAKADMVSSVPHMQEKKQSLPGGTSTTTTCRDETEPKQTETIINGDQAGEFMESSRELNDATSSATAREGTPELLINGDAKESIESSGEMAVSASSTRRSSRRKQASLQRKKALLESGGCKSVNNVCSVYDDRVAQTKKELIRRASIQGRLNGGGDSTLAYTSFLSVGKRVSGIAPSGGEDLLESHATTPSDELAATVAADSQAKSVDTTAAATAKDGSVIAPGDELAAMSSGKSSRKRLSAKLHDCYSGGTTQPGSNGSVIAPGDELAAAAMSRKGSRERLSAKLQDCYSGGGMVGSDENQAESNGNVAPGDELAAAAIAPGDELAAATISRKGSRERLSAKLQDCYSGGGMVGGDGNQAESNGNVAPGHEFAATTSSRKSSRERLSAKLHDCYSGEGMVGDDDGNQENEIGNTDGGATPGDNLAAAMMPSGLSAKRLEVNGGMDATTASDKGVATNRDPLSSLNDKQIDVDGAAAAARETNQEEQEAQPGAYPVEGRAFGSYPAWGRHNPQGANPPPLASAQSLDDSGAMTLGDASLMEDGQAGDSELMQVTATILDEDELEDKVRQEMRQEMLQNAVQAEMVEPSGDDSAKFKRLYVVSCAVFVLIFVGTVVGLSVGLANKSDETQPPHGHLSPSPTFVPSVSPTASPTYDPRPTLEVLKGRGYLRCGVGDYIGLYQKDNETGEEKGFQFDLCHAVAAAIFGDTDTSRVNATVVPVSERFTSLADRTIDLLARSPTFTMERDVSLGASFAVPFMYDGLRFSGKPPYGACANNLSSYFGECRLLKICVTDGSSHIAVVERLFPQWSIVPVDDIVDAFINGSCNAMAGEKFMVAKIQLDDRGYNTTRDYEIGTNIFSKEPLALATRDDDVEFSDFVGWIMQALFAAEEQGITQTNASDFLTTSVFGDEYASMFVDAISAVGNFGEIYTRHLEDLVPREDVDKINTDGDTGLLLSNPFGGVDTNGSEPLEDSTLAKVAVRGYLRCGVSPSEGFAAFDSSTDDWSGLDVDYCNALSASIFKNATGHTRFVNLTGQEDGFSSLANGTVDVLSGASANLVRDVSKPGASFSQPYFYDPPSGFAENSLNRTTRALATRQDDEQWSSFVYWVVACTFHAEEKYIDQSSYEKMPLVNLFGPDYLSMFQDVIFAVGNSKEIYNRNPELPSRGGRNQLNENPFGPQHYPLPFN